MDIKAMPGHFVLYTIGMIVASALARIGWEVGGLIWHFIH